MMSKELAIAYGQFMGVQFHIMNQYGGLMGGTQTEDQAKELIAEMAKKWPDMIFRIVPAGT